MAKRKVKPKPKVKLRAKSKAKKSAVRKKISKAAPMPKLKPMPGQPAAIIIAAPEKRVVGTVEHFYNKINVGIIKLDSSDLALGDEISIEGPHTNVKQKVSSMQLEHKPVNIARIGQVVGLKVQGRVRENDVVYKVIKKF